MENKKIKQILERLDFLDGSAGIFLVALFFGFILMFLNVHIETYEKTKVETVVLDYWGHSFEQKNLVFVGELPFKVYCDVPARPCSVFEYADEQIVCYEWASKEVGHWKSDYIQLNNFGGKYCTIEKTVKRLRLTWL